MGQLEQGANRKKITLEMTGRRSRSIGGVFVESLVEICCTLVGGGGPFYLVDIFFSFSWSAGVLVDKMGAQRCPVCSLHD